MASLIKVTGGKTPARAIQFTGPDGVRRTIRIGKVGLEAARRFKTRIELLLSNAITGTAPDSETSTWLVRLPDATHEKLAAVGLVAPREPEPTAPRLHVWVDKFIGQRPDLKPAGVAEYKHCGSLLCNFLWQDDATR